MTGRDGQGSAAAEYFAGGVAVVTGGGSGFGAAMALRFAGAGMAVAVLDIDAANAEAVAARLAAGGTKALALRMDVADRESVFRAADEVRDGLGGCTVLCANVGVQQFGAIDRLSPEDWRWVLEVNVLGPVNTVAAFLPLLRASTGNRHIALTASSSAFSPGIRMAAYIASKYAVTGYAETLRLELAPEGIGVSILVPAGMMTRHLESSGLARPAALGVSQLRREDIDAMMASRQVDAASHVATAEYATRHLLADLAANERYIFTHGEYRAQLLADHAAVLRAHDRGLRD